MQIRSHDLANGFAMQSDIALAIGEIGVFDAADIAAICLRGRPAKSSFAWKGKCESLYAVVSFLIGSSLFPTRMLGFGVGALHEQSVPHTDEQRQDGPYGVEEGIDRHQNFSYSDRSRDQVLFVPGIRVCNW